MSTKLQTYLETFLKDRSLNDKGGVMGKVAKKSGNRRLLSRSDQLFLSLKYVYEKNKQETKPGNKCAETVNRSQDVVWPILPPCVLIIENFLKSYLGMPS